MQTEIKIKAVYPLLPSQRGLLVDSLAGESDVYRQQICVKLVKPIAIERLKSNILKTIEHHDLLRTIFDWSDGEPLRIVVDGIEPSILTFTASGEQPLSTILTNEKDSLKPVDETPPIRYAIIQADEDQLLALTYHHILLDGPSVDILLRQIITGVNPAPSPSSAYTEWFKNTIDDTEQNTWRSLLATVGKQDGTITKLNRQNETQRYKEMLDPEVYTRVLEKAKRLHTTPAVYIQSIWSAWAKAFFKKDSFLYGLVLSTRTPNLTDNTIGPYISTVPWTISKLPSDFDALVQQTNNQILDIQTAKHLALGDIVKLTTPSVMNFDSILTITTRAVQDTSLYKVITTSEKTGYALSVDIDLSDTILITFSSSLPDMDKAIKSFRNYFEAQVHSSALIEITNHYIEPDVLIEDHLPYFEPRLLTKYVGEVLELALQDISTSNSFLEAGGDSISALKLKSQLRTAGFNISIGDILKASSLTELAKKTHPLNSTATPNSKEILEATHVSLHAQYGNNVEDVTSISPAAYIIVSNYRNGFGQDYHEQTAFRLDGTLDEATFTNAINLLAQEIFTLRITYPNQHPDLQVITKDSRTITTFTEVTNQTFEAFAEETSSLDWENPYDLESGPLLRVFVAPTSNDDTYLFMSFSALVTDGWSFAVMLERLFHIYTGLLSGTYLAKTIDPYYEYLKHPGSHPQINYEPIRRSDDYEDVTTGKDFTIDTHLTQRLLDRSKESQSTISEVILKALSSTLIDEGFSRIEIYENGRDDIHYFESVGPYSFLSHKIINNQNKKRAYYVFENYPKDSENRLKHGQVKGFNEHGNWRKDLLPPAVDVGFLFDASDDTIVVRILVRGTDTNPDTYWEKLLSVLEKK